MVTFEVDDGGKGDRSGRFHRGSGDFIDTKRTDNENGTKTQPKESFASGISTVAFPRE